MNFRLVDVTFRRGRFDGVRAERETRRNLTAALSAWLGDQSDYVKRLVKSSLIDGAVGNLRTLRILLARYFDEQTEQGLPESVTRAVKAVSDAALDTVLDDTEPEENARIDESWVAGFDERYDRKMAARLNKANLGAVVRALGELGDKDHVKAALTGLDAWPDNRAVKMAQTEIVMATNEAKIAGYRACGYESVWQSTPSCCKICQRYNNETVTALKPPLHKGCTCGVAKGAKRNTAQEEQQKLLEIEAARKQQLIENPDKALPNVATASIDERKFTGYLFNPDNPQGYSKGLAFTSRLGYNADNWQELKDEIESVKAQYTATQTGENDFGTRYQQEVILHGIKGRPANVIIGWQVDGSNTHLTTLYICEAKEL